MFRKSVLPRLFSPAAAALLCLFNSCWLSDPVVEKPAPPIPGMVKITASGKSFQQGSADPFSGPDERPVMTVSFAYDFWMDAIEVTQEKFFEVTGRRPVPDSSRYGSGPGIPVYHVTWFDAAAYCNALSILHGLDTVYAYSGRKHGSSGNIIGMDGLQIHFEKQGIRLPTEAEWEFAAGGTAAKTFPWGPWSDSGKAAEYAWYSGNSENTAHPAGTLKKNSLGLYDMAGNVMEWVNDWKNTYLDTSVENSLGNIAPNTLFERVLKGGAFSFGIHALRTANRKSTYPSIASSRAEYAGFRCAAGAVRNGQYITSAGITAPPGTVRILASRSTLQSVLSTDNARLCFVSGSGSSRRLGYIDFRAPEINTRWLEDTVPVFHPAISPNGSYIAYCTRNEGASQPSSVFLRPLDSGRDTVVRLPAECAYIPRWWVEPYGMQDTFLVYTNSGLDNGDENLWRQTSTFYQKITRGIPDGPSEIFYPQGSFHDGVSRNGKFLATGFSRLLVRDLVNKTTAPLFLYPANGKDAEASSQVCNLSLSPHLDSPLLAFLDFGYTGISAITGTPYGIHEYLFISNPAGTDITAIRRPENENAWDHAEWSNHRDFIVSGATDAAGSHNSVYLIDLSQNRHARLLEGEDLFQPCLWIANTDLIRRRAEAEGINLDSAGRYMEPLGLFNQQYQMIKMRHFWARHNQLEIVFLGNSRMSSGIAPEYVTGYSCLNMSDAGQGFNGVRRITEDYLLNQCPNLKMVGMSLYLSVFGAERADVTWTEGMARSRGYLYDKSRHFWKDSLPQNFSEYIENASSLSYSNFDSLGFENVPPRGWGGNPPEILMRDFTPRDPYFMENLTAFEDFCSRMDSAGIHLLIINFPQSPGYRNTASYGRHGPTWENAGLLMEEIRAVIDSYDYVHLYDAYNNGVHDYTDEDAHDFDHLAWTGAVKLTGRVDSLVHGLLD